MVSGSAQSFIRNRHLAPELYNVPGSCESKLSDAYSIGFLLYYVNINYTTIVAVEIPVQRLRVQTRVCFLIRS